MADENREWIEARYGPIRTGSKTMIVMFVPVMGGTAIGIGETEEAALLALRDDLRAPTLAQFAAQVRVAETQL